MALDGLEASIATVEARANIRVSEFLGFDYLYTPIQSVTSSDQRYKYCGEINAKGRPHGRCICIYNSGSVRIGYYENGRRAGNHITIYSCGRLDLRVTFEKYGERWYRYTWNKPSGTEEKYDKE